MMQNEKQDINCDFNHIKHVPKDKDQTHTYCYGATDSTLCLLSSRKKNITFNHFKPWGTKQGFFSIL